MAITIKSLELCNFYNYYGSYEENRYEFEEGVNIVVADNGAGKSKLFNSLLWIFKNSVLDSDVVKDKEQSINDPKTAIKIVSDKAKKEVEVGGHVECGVKLTYSNGRDKTYEIHKRFYITKKNEKYTSQSSWSYDYRDTDITSKEEYGKTKIIFNSEEKGRIINSLIRSDLRQYSFFQGEEVDSIIDFTDPRSIKKAIDILAKIDDVDNLVELSERLISKSDDDLRKKRKGITKNADFLEKQEVKRQLENRNFENYKKDLLLYQEEWEIASADYQEYEGRITNAQELSRITSKIKDKLIQKQRRQSDLESHTNNINERFFNGNFSWLSLGMENILEDYYSVLKQYREDLAIQKSQGGDTYVPIFPIGSIDIKSLERILEDKHCHVCDRSFEDDQKAFEVVAKLKDWVSNKNKSDYKGNDLQEFFDEIHLKSHPFLKDDTLIIEEIKAHRIKERELLEKIKVLSKEIKILNSEKFDLVGHSTSLEDDSIKAKDVISGWKSSSDRKNKNKIKIDNTKDKILLSKKTRDSLKEEIEKKSKGSVSNEEIELNHMLSDIDEAIIQAKSNIYTDNINKLEIKANYFYETLIKYNKLKGAKLKFEKEPNDGVALNVIGSDGHIVSGNSEGFQRIRKLAVVMGIMSLSNTFYYPLFADAPLSSFGKGFIRSFFEVIPEVFPQSIILIKDIYKSDSDSKLDDIGESLYNDDKVKRIYLNESPDGVEQNELKTSITKLK